MILSPRTRVGFFVGQRKATVRAELLIGCWGADTSRAELRGQGFTLPRSCMTGFRLGPAPSHTRCGRSGPAAAERLVGKRLWAKLASVWCLATCRQWEGTFDVQWWIWRENIYDLVYGLLALGVLGEVDVWCLLILARGYTSSMHGNNCRLSTQKLGNLMNCRCWVNCESLDSYRDRCARPLSI